MHPCLGKRRVEWEFIYYVEILKMNFERTYVTKLVWGTFAFSLFFILFCTAVFVFLPADSKNNTVPVRASSVTQLSLEIPEIEEIDLFENVDFSEQPVELSHKEDSGLVLYRQPQSKAAVEWFYSRITNDRDITMAILSSADKFDVPLSLAFALAYTESQYKSNAMHKNANGSVDRGLFQLNSNSWPNLTEADFYNPKTSAYYGLSHLNYCLKTAGNEIAALAMYNAGSTKVRHNNTPQTTLNYISQIQKYRGMLEQGFATEVLAFYDGESDYKLLAKY